MKKLNITFREVKHGKFKGTIDAVFLDPFTFENNFRLTCYSKIGQHSSGDISYFYHSMKPAENYQDLLKELQFIYNDYEIIVHKKLPNYTSLLNQYRKKVG